jgi:glycosyltransferase involved in cell wall biosynthesis
VKIVHVFRSPVGGLFRHVCDLAAEQAALGHDVGLVCDSLTGGDAALPKLANLSQVCAIGMARIPMPRLPHPSDAGNITHVADLVRDAQAEIVHCHGAKGGLYGRVAAARTGAKSVYTPHGGSLHYTWSNITGALSLGMERLLRSKADGFIFVCDYEKGLFDAKIGLAGKPFKIVQNGLKPADFDPVSPLPDATDLLFVGEMRRLKGVDLLLHALLDLPDITATLVGDGEEEPEFKQLAEQLGLQQRVRFAGRLPFAQALPLGRILVVPSRNESFPYVVLEGIAAGRVVLASPVGGIPEILPAEMMFSDVSAPAIQATIAATRSSPNAFAAIAASTLGRIRMQNTTAQMTSDILEFYSTLGRA